MDQSLARRAIQQLHGVETGGIVGVAGLGPLQRGAKLRALRAVTNGSCLGLAKGLLGGRDIGHELISNLLGVFDGRNGDKIKTWTPRMSRQDFDFHRF